MNHTMSKEETKQRAYIYQIKNKKNGKIYIGSTNNYLTRWRCHISELNRHSHGNAYLQNAWNKYGQNAFEFSILDTVDIAEQFLKEQEWLNKLSPFGDGGYNILRLNYVGAQSPHVIHTVCINCGKTFKTYHPRAVRCLDCRNTLEVDKNTDNECIHCVICELRKRCRDSLVECTKHFMCFECDHANVCQLIENIEDSNSFYANLWAEGYDSLDDFWECNGI